MTGKDNLGRGVGEDLSKRGLGEKAGRTPAHDLLDSLMAPGEGNLRSGQGGLWGVCTQHSLSRPVCIRYLKGAI